MPGVCLPCAVSGDHERCSALHGAIIPCGCPECGPNEPVALAEIERRRS